MFPVYRFRRFHRVLAIVIGIQILFWTLSGVYFAWTDLDEIHGDHLRVDPSRPVLETGWISPSAVEFPNRKDPASLRLQSLDLIQILSVPHYRFRFAEEDGTRSTVLVNARSGAIRPPLTEGEAIAMARASFLPAAELQTVRRLEDADVGPHHEYRGGALPAWQVEFAHPSNTRIYVAASQGQVTKHRNAPWRVFDFLWMLHTMDYLGRDDINNPVLRMLSVFGFFVVLSGYLLWVQTRRRQRSRA